VHPPPRRHDQGDGEDDDRAGHDRSWLDGLAQDERTQDDRDDRVHIGIRRDEREWGDAQHPAEDGECEDAADDRQVEQAEEGVARDGRDVEMAGLAGQDGHQAEDEAT